jgi:molecular chaperone HscB
MNDYFEVFDLPRKLQVDLDALQGKFYQMSRQHHPDFHQLAAPEDQAVALERSALVNRAYRTLRDPLSRLEHVIALEEGQEEEAPVKPRAPMDLLQEMLEVQEALEEAKASGLHGEVGQRLARDRQGLIERQAAGEATISGRFAEWDRAIDAGLDTRPLLQWFKQALAARAYLGTVIDDLNEALGEDQGSHVSHRRH